LKARMSSAVGSLLHFLVLAAIWIGPMVLSSENSGSELHLHSFISLFLYYLYPYIYNRTIEHRRETEHYQLVSFFFF
jgi:hypothetical protein